MTKTNARIKWLLRCASPFAVALVVFPMDESLAQTSRDDFRNMTVLQRARPEFDAKGIPLSAGFRLLPTLAVTEAYTDNLYWTESNTVSDFQTTISPKVNLASNWSRHQFNLTGYADINRFARRDTENTVEYGIGGALALELGGGGSLGLSTGYDRITVRRSDPESRDRIAPEQVSIANTKAEWAQRYAFLLLGARIEFLDRKEASALDRDKDRTEYGGAFRIGYVFSPALNGFLEPFYTKRDFKLATDFAGVDRDSDVSGINAGIGYDITGVLYGETKIGWYRTSFADPGTKSNVGLSVESNTTWNLTARDTLIFTLARKNVVTNTFDASSRVLTGGMVQYQHDVRRNIIFQADLSYYDDDFIESNPRRVDTRIIGRMQADYLFNRYLSAYVSFSQTDISSTIAFESSNESRAMIGIRTQI